MIKRWFTARKAREEERLLEREKALEADRTGKEEMLSKARLDMAERLCPFRPTTGCALEKCVHFKDGRVVLWFSDGVYPSQWMMSNPSCKLWRGS